MVNVRRGGSGVLTRRSDDENGDDVVELSWVSQCDDTPGHKG